MVSADLGTHGSLKGNSGLSHRYCNHRRDRVQPAQPLDRSSGGICRGSWGCGVQHADGCGFGGWAAVDAACGGRGCSKDQGKEVIHREGTLCV
ncbi:hypothetical protein HPP92_012392 [Vanilla planifolia]|uniref:Uncharacterized protein n=1 Tax=Vanilla planifolia TaxID=51239 RepID=A0A835QTP0_VANPL|nr:hypothetical protein HPP92_012392 [Vanilla planifolia]